MLTRTSLLGAAAASMLLLTAGCAGSGADRQGAHAKTELLVSAAASMKDSLDVIERLYEKEHPGIDLTFNYGSSGTLQKQIEQGAPADLFFSAGQKQMDALIARHLIDSYAALLQNELVAVVPADSGSMPADAAALTNVGVKTVAVGQPESVPAGQYAKEALTKLGVWDKLQSRLVYAKDVRQVLTYVESGNAEAGFVYRTDALTSNKVKVAFAVPDDSHQPIVYPAGVLKQTKHKKETDALYRYLQSEEAKDVFAKYGFKLPKT